MEINSDNKSLARLFCNFWLEPRITRFKLSAFSTACVGKEFDGGGAENTTDKDIINVDVFFDFLTAKFINCEADKTLFIALLNLIKFKYEPLTTSFIPFPFCLATSELRSIDFKRRLYLETKEVIFADNSD